MLIITTFQALRRVTVAVVAIGGYGAGYVRTLLKPAYQRRAKIVAAIDPTPEHCPDLAILKKMKVPIYPTPEAFYRKTKRAPDLVIIASPIHFHAPHAIAALEHGSSVLCEKPMCATVQEAEALRAARDDAGKFVIIGYQRSFTPGNIALHRDVRRGLFGKPKRLKWLCLAPRAGEYYDRNNWAGMRKSPDGRWVLDSPANNAVAHMLHAMFHTLGDRRNTAARPASVVAELYRANDITNFDTCGIRAVTTEGVEVLFYASHAVPERNPMTYRYEFEKAVVGPGAALSTGSGRRSADGSIVARFKDGRTKTYRDLGRKHIEGKLNEALRLARAGKTNVTCGIEAAFSQTLCINGAQDSMPRIVSLRKLRQAQGEGEKRVWFVPGLAEVLKECYRRNKLPCELGAPWAKPGKFIDLTNYRRFPGGR